MYIKEYTTLHPKEQRQLLYKRKYKEEHPEWDDSMIRLRDDVAERIGSGVVALDVGCGRGDFVIDELRPRFSRAVGIDLTKDATAKNVSCDEIVIGNVEQMPFADNTFDLAVSLWVMEHVKHPEKVFREVARVLKPGGLFAFVTPNRRSLLVFFRRLLNYRTAKRLVRSLYGREEADTFDVVYGANTVRKIEHLAKEIGFAVELLMENADPSYTSFGSTSYRVSVWLARFPFFRTHIIAVLSRDGLTGTGKNVKLKVYE